MKNLKSILSLFLLGIVITSQYSCSRDEINDNEVLVDTVDNNELSSTVMTNEEVEEETIPIGPTKEELAALYTQKQSAIAWLGGQEENGHTLARHWNRTGKYLLSRIHDGVRYSTSFYFGGSDYASSKDIAAAIRWGYNYAVRNGLRQFQFRPGNIGNKSTGAGYVNGNPVWKRKLKNIVITVGATAAGQVYLLTAYPR